MADNQDFLRHFGIPGQKWGVRRFQNEDGSLTEEGRQRYLELNPNSQRLYNEVVNRANRDLGKINKKYDNVDLINDDRGNLEYTKEIRDMWQQHYRDVLAKDIGTDPSSLKGQKWLDDVIGYRTNFDKEIEDLERKIKGPEQEKKKEVTKEKAVRAEPAKQKEKKPADMHPKPLKDYSKTKMSAEDAFSQVYEDLEKIYPNFNNFSQKMQDSLFINYINDSNLYKWTY